MSTGRAVKNDLQQNNTIIEISVEIWKKKKKS